MANESMKDIVRMKITHSMSDSEGENNVTPCLVGKKPRKSKLEVDKSKPKIGKKADDVQIV